MPMKELVDFYIRNFKELFQGFTKIAFGYHLKSLENDIAQEVFLRVKMLKPTKIKNPRAYIFTTFANQCIHVLRSRREENYGVFPNETLFLGEETPLLGMIVQEDFEILQRRIERLSPYKRNAVKLYCLEQLPYERCAELLHISQTSVRVRVCEGVKELKGVYKSEAE